MYVMAEQAVSSSIFFVHMEEVQIPPSVTKAGVERGVRKLEQVDLMAVETQSVTLHGKGLVRRCAVRLFQKSRLGRPVGFVAVVTEVTSWMVMGRFTLVEVPVAGKAERPFFPGEEGLAFSSMHLVTGPAIGRCGHWVQELRRLELVACQALGSRYCSGGRRMLCLRCWLVTVGAGQLRRMSAVVRACVAGLGGAASGYTAGGALLFGFLGHERAGDPHKDADKHHADEAPEAPAVFYPPAFLFLRPPKKPPWLFRPSVCRPQPVFQRTVMQGTNRLAWQA